MDLQGRRARREERRRAVRRRRRRAAILLGAVAVVVVVAVAFLAGGSSGGTQAASRSPRGSIRTGIAHSPATASTAGGSAGTGRPGSEAVPILMYHVIAPAPSGAPFPGLYVTPSEFAAQMQALRHAGWHAVTLDELEAYWRRGVALGAGKPIVLSFDNGYHSQYAQALPILERLGWVGDENIQLSGLPPSQGGLSQQEVRGLIAAGWELDTQGFSHADLITLDAAQLHFQIAVTRQVLQRRYGVPVSWFCYPSGHYDPTVIAAVKAAGFTGSTTVVPGWAHPSDDPYRLHRLRVLGGTTPAELLGLLAGIRADPPAPISYNGA
jgi:peptidoglycan/xylan/chitin deacetylase (PgdA/CDA1 family)